MQILVLIKPKAIYNPRRCDKTVKSSYGKILMERWILMVLIERTFTLKKQIIKTGAALLQYCTYEKINYIQNLILMTRQSSICSIYRQSICNDSIMLSE